MDTKSNFGDIVNNRLQTLKESPDDLVWQNIELELKRKKKRKAIIFWLSGLGLGVLLFLLMLVNPFSKTVKNHIANPQLNVIDDTAKHPFSEGTKTPPAVTDEQVESHVDGSSPKEKTSTIIENNPMDDTNADPFATTSPKKAQEGKLNTTLVTKTQKNDVPNSNNRSKSGASKISSSKENSSRFAENPQEKSNLITQDRKTIDRLRSNIIDTAKHDSITVANQKVKDSINGLHQSNELASHESETRKDSSLTKHQSKWSVTPQFIVSNFGAFNSKTSNNISTNYGILVGYQATEDIHLRFGARRLYVKQTIDSVQNNVDYLQFPLEVKYTPFKKKISPYAIAGFSYYHLKDYSNNVPMPLSNTNYIDYASGFGLNFGLGIEGKIFNKTFLNLESNFYYQFKPNNQYNAINTYILSVNLGIEYRF